LVFGFDFQCSLSKSFGIDYDAEELPLSIYDAVVDPNTSLEDIIVPTDIPTLHLVPESDELSMLDRQILSRQRREYILEDMLAPIRSKYDVILIDCPPQWLEMVSNSLYVADCIVSPVLADGESYHSFKKFMRELQKFMKVMHKDYEYVKFIPNQVDTRAKYTSSFQKKYIQEYPDIFTTSYLRDAIQLQESGTARQSVIEYGPSTPIAEDFFYAALEIWDGIRSAIQEHAEEPQRQSIQEKSLEA
jgi:chromosome partitioning protein